MKPFFVSLALFALALIPRLPGLGRFLTPDEFLWVDRSRNFLAGLTNPAYQCDSVVEQWHFAAQGLACTLRTGHPGVTTMWTGSFGFILRWLEDSASHPVGDGRPASLYDYVVAVSTNPLDPTFIAPERLGTVLITSLWVVAVYWLARRLFGSSVALLGTILIALDPFHIALSRVIHHDALSVSFMTLSVLCAFIYWGESKAAGNQKSEGDARRLVVSRGGFVFNGPGRQWLILSGLLAGLAFLSKLSSLYLMPFIALTGLWFTIEKIWTQNKEYGGGKATLFRASHFGSLLVTVFEGLLWFALAIAVIFALWPAMWVAPFETIQTAFLLGFKYTTGGHAKGNFLLGQVSQDPGALFYPVTWLYRTSPLVLVGGIITLIAWGANGWAKVGSKFERDDSHSASPVSPPLFSFFRYLPLILLFILGYYLLMTIGEKKQERYFLPAYPWLDFIAAAGLVMMYNWLTFRKGARSGTSNSSLTFPARLFTFHSSLFTLYISFITLFQAALIYPHFPYYFTYYNPLLGDIQGAAKAVTVGWGEGLDLAAAYLNQNTDPAHTRVASWYASTFAPFYHGNTISYSKEKGKALAGDYVIFYINQTQRRFPDEVMFDYFEKRFPNPKVITLQGLDYAWIYPSLGVDHYLEDQTYTGIASLLAWQSAKGDTPLTPGRPNTFELYWEYLGKQLDEPFFFRLVDAQEQVIAEAQSQPIPGESPPPEQWREGEIIAETGTLTVPLGAPPGLYRLQIGFYTHAPAVAAGELLFTLPKAETLVTVATTDSAVFTLPAEATPINQPFDNSLTLLGANSPASIRLPSAQGIPLDLYWRVEKATPADFAVHMGLMDEAGKAQQAWFDLSLAETIDPAKFTWQPGDIVHTSWRLPMSAELPAGTYYFDLVLPSQTEHHLPFGRLMITPPEMGKN